MIKKNIIYNENCILGLNKLPNKSVDCIITDPPYGVLPKGKVMRNKTMDKFEWDNIDIFKFTKKWHTLCLSKLKDDSFMFVFWSQKYLKEGFKIFKPDRLIFWRYNNLINVVNGGFAYDYEPIFVIMKGKPKLIKGKHSCDLEYTKPQSNFIKNKLVHPTQKPLGIIKHIIEVATKKNDTILDPFIGSGTLAIACIQTDREYIGFEISKKYMKIIKKRIKEQNEKDSNKLD